MNDFYTNTTLPGSGVMSGSVRESSINPQSLQNKPVAIIKSEVDKEEDEKRQVIANRKSSVDFVKGASKEQLDKMVSNLNDAVQNVQRSLEFNIDKDAGRIVINVVDKISKDIVRQIPSEEVLVLARNLHRISKETSENLEERMSRHAEQSFDIINSGVLFKGKT